MKTGFLSRYYHEHDQQLQQKNLKERIKGKTNKKSYNVCRQEEDIFKRFEYAALGNDNETDIAD